MLADWNSGATLLSILLNNHSSMICNGESFPFGHEEEIDYCCSCGSQVPNCKFFRETTAHMLDDSDQNWKNASFRMLPRFSDNQLANKFLNGVRYAPVLRDLAIRSIPTFRNAAAKFMLAHTKFMKCALDFSGATVYVDGTKNIRRAELLAESDRVSLKIIHLVRDGRGVCHSFYKKMEEPSVPALTERANRWTHYLGNVELLTTRHPNMPILTMRYEDMCSDPENSLTTICDFVGLPFEQKMIGGEVSEHHILGNAMRSGFNGQIKEDKAWINGLPKEYESAVTGIMRDDLLRFGYI